jgi:serine-type D-Ala-D-Ala carboxypeptidase (penicillin-binding protein 5/6)
MAGRSIISALAVAALAFAPFGSAFAQQKSATAQPKKEEVSITAPHAILIDADNGGVLYERSSDESIFPASLAKLMTAEFVFNEIKSGRLKLTDEFRVSENAWRKGGAPSGGSTMYAELHSKISVENLLRGVIIQSANDACIVLAEGIAGNEAEFAAKLTQRSREIGLTKSVFTNSNGLPDPGMKVTSRDLSILARHIILTYPEFFPIYGEKEFTWNKIRQQNRNPLLGTVTGADGMKTGFTKDAGYGLVGTAQQNSLRLIAVVNGAKTPEDRATDAKKLLERGFRAFEARILFAEGQTVGDARIFAGDKGRVPLVATGPVKLMVPKDGSGKLLARVVYTGPVPAPVEEGATVATLKVWRNDNLVLQVPLKASESVGRGSLTQRAMDAASELVINLFRAGAQKL